MLQDLERTIKRMNEKEKDEEYRNLVYDLESFIIDMSYGEDDGDAGRQSYLGKMELVEKLFDEKETKTVFSKIRPVLLCLGVRENVKGFRMLEMCVLEAARVSAAGKEYQMKRIYPVVARIFGMNAHNCERLCRYALKGIVPTGEFSRKYPFFEELTHRTYEEVTVKELVDILVKYVLLKCNLRSIRNIEV